jgi:hypothetical protein
MAPHRENLTLLGKQAWLRNMNIVDETGRGPSQLKVRLPVEGLVKGSLREKWSFLSLERLFLGKSSLCK